MGFYDGVTGEQVSFDVFGDEDLVEEACRENGLDDNSLQSLLDFWKANVEDPSSRIDNHMAREKLYEKMFEEGTQGMTSEEKTRWTRNSLKRNALFKQHAWIAYGADFYNEIGVDLVILSTQPGLQTKFWSEMDFGKRPFPYNWYMVDPDLPHKNDWLPWFEHVQMPLVWISLRVDESGLKAFDSWTPMEAHENFYNEGTKIVRNCNIDDFNRADISQSVRILFATCLNHISKLFIKPIFLFRKLSQTSTQLQSSRQRQKNNYRNS